jgi:sensor domain CHASE-containing protein
MIGLIDKQIVLTDNSPYILVIDTHPTSAVDSEGKIGGGIVHILVFSNNLLQTREIALNQSTESDFQTGFGFYYAKEVG